MFACKWICIQFVFLLYAMMAVQKGMWIVVVVGLSPIVRLWGDYSVMLSVKIFLRDHNPYLLD